MKGQADLIGLQVAPTPADEEEPQISEEGFSNYWVTTLYSHSIQSLKCTST